MDLPSKSMAPNALRDHKRDPLGFVAIASQLATIIEPLIEMTGADNPTLARRSCETIRTLGPGTSEEDRASRALGALAVLAVGQMGASKAISLSLSLSSGETMSRRRRLRRPFSSRQKRGKTTVPVVVVVFLFSSTSISSTKSLASALCPTRFI